MYLQSRIFYFLLKLLNVLHYVWHSVVHCWWRLNGTAKRVDAKMCGEDTKEPAQVLKVIFLHPLLKKGHAIPQMYFTVHERFAPAEIVLNNRMHLLSVNSKTATFTEVDTDILDVRKNPFMFRGHNCHTIRLVVLPIKFFYALTDNVDVRDRRVVWVFHTARCGSTAWSQAFNFLPGWTVFSEPQAILYSIMYGDHGYYSAESYSKSAACKQMVVAVIKMHVRHAPPGGSVFWKTSIYEDYLMEMIADSFPQHKYLAAYRDSFPSICSYNRIFQKVEVLRYHTEVILSHDPSDEEWWGHLPNLSFWTDGCDHNFCRRVVTAVRPQVCVEWFCFLWAAKAAAIKRAIQNGVKVQAINYNSLSKDRRPTVEKVFSYLDLPAHYVDIACEALKSDSQGEVEHVSWDSRTKLDPAEWSKDPDVVKRCNMILEAFDLPHLYSSLEFSGSF